MDLTVHVDGRDFRDGPALAVSVEILSNYASGLNSCLDLAATKFEVSVAPIVRLRYASSGSLNVETFIGAAVASIAPIAGEVAHYAWQIFEKGSKLVSLANIFMKKHEKPMPIQIQDSPGAFPIFVLGNNNTVIVSPDVLAAARKIHKPLDNIATTVNQFHAKEISVVARDNDESVGSLLIDDGNSHDFHVESIESTETEPVTITCHIFRFNKKSGLGGLDFTDSETGKTRSIAFQVSITELLETCVEAMNSGSSTITALREMSTNSLGETTIERFHIQQITNND